MARSDGQGGKRCYPCFRARENERTRDWRKVNPGHSVAKHRKSIGWPKEKFDAAWLAQRGLCACCGRPMHPSGQRADSVVAEHDHATGEGRALVCLRCNMAIGYYEKYGAICAIYLARYAPWPTLGACAPEISQLEPMAAQP